MEMEETNIKNKRQGMALQKEYYVLILKASFYSESSSCGSVGRAVTSNTRDLHPNIGIILPSSVVNSNRRDENKGKKAVMAHLYKFIC